MAKSTQGDKENNAIIEIDENELNKLLKDASLYEDGLTKEEKKQLLECILASKSSAKDEEVKRSASGNNDYQKDAVEVSKLINISGDSDPIVTFQSQPNSNNNSPSLSYQIRQQSRDASNVKTMSSQVSRKTPHSVDKSNSIKSLSNKATVSRRARSLFSNASIVKDVVISDESDDKTIIYESGDEDNAKPCQSAMLKSAQDLSTEGQATNNKIARQTESYNSKIVMKSAHITDINCTNNELDELSIIDSDKLMFGLNTENIQKSIFGSQSPKLSRNCRRPQNTYKNNALCSGKNKLKIFSNITSSSDSDVDKEPSTSRKFNPLFDPTASSYVNSTPLERKNLLSERPSQMFMKAPHETESKCVERICSIITNWQLSFSEYQRKLPRYIKWGAPIIVDRQLKGMIVKSPTKESTRNAPHVSSVYEFLSSESEPHISDKSDDDFEWFSSKKKSKVGKRAQKGKTEVKINDSSPQNLNFDITIKNKRSRNPTRKGKGMRSRKKTSKNELNTIEESKAEIQDDQVVKSDSECSPSLLPDIYTKPVEGPSTQSDILNKASHSSKNSRKSSELHPSNENSNNARSDTRSSSVDLINSPSSSKTKNINEDKAPSILSSPSTSETTHNNNTSFDASSTLKNGIKRKQYSSSSNMPPSKKLAGNESEEESDIQMNFVIGPGPLRYRGTPKSLPVNVEKPSISGVKNGQTKVSVEGAALTDAMIEAQIESPSTQETSQEVSEEVIGATALPDEKEVECPLCQRKFPQSKVEIHASDCNGLPEENDNELSNKMSLRSRIQMNQNEDEDIMFLNSSQT